MAALAGIDLVMTVIGIGGLFAGMGISGEDSLSNTKTIQKDINDMTAKTNSYEEKYNKLLNSQGTQQARLVAELNIIIQDLGLLSKQIIVAKKKHAEQYKKIQTTGVIFISFIIFIFILKMFGFYSIVGEIITYPFKMFYKTKK
jgi:hypothetical protein